MVVIIPNGDINLVRALPRGSVRLLIFVTDAAVEDATRAIRRSAKRALAGGGSLIVAPSLEAAVECL